MLNDAAYRLASQHILDQWKARARQSLDFFTEEVLLFDNASHQREWYEVLGNSALKKIALAAPRGHSKTTAFSVNYPLWEIARNHTIRILMVSNTESQSQGFLREIIGRIERDEEYRLFAGNLKPEKPDKWTEREIIVAPDNLSLKDPTISTVGMGGTILSKRADIIICDDVLNFENTRTVNQRKKVKDWFHQVLLPVLVPGGRLIVAGTVWHPDDLLHELLKDPLFDYRKRFQAIIKEPDNKALWEEWYSILIQGTPEARAQAAEFYQAHDAEMNAGAEVLWPERFPYAHLYLLRRSNSVAFEKMYQNRIISSDDQKFQEEWLAAALEKGRNMRFVKALSRDARMEFRAMGGGIDLSSAEEDSQGDDNAMVSLGLRRLDERMVILNIERGKFAPADFRKLVAEQYQGFLHDRVIVETVEYQKSMKRDMENTNIPIEAYQTGGEKFDPFIGVESLAILFENERIVIPSDPTDPRTSTLAQQLVDGLRQFPYGHTDDSVMAFWFAHIAIRDLAASQPGFFSFMKDQAQQLQAKGAAASPGNIKAWTEVARNQGQAI